MNSLLSYGSDDDFDDSPDERSVPVESSRNIRKQDDTNYDEVQMSLSEDSNDESKSSPAQRGRYSPKNKEDKRRKDRPDRDRYMGKEKDEDRNGRSSKDDDRERGRNRLSDSRGRDRDRHRDEDRGRWDERRGRSRDRSRERERYSVRDKYSRDKPFDRDRRDRDRRRSKSPRDGERPKSRSRSPRRDRSRSNSRERRRFPYKKFERGANREKFERMGFEPKKTDSSYPAMASGDEQKDRFFVPGITGRFREQIEKRKLLWQKKEEETPKQGPSKAPVATKVWEATTFAQDTDGKVANKFKRLMGMKDVGEGSKPATDVLKKQEEMFSSMEQQYEVARTATHTMRGVGLGFGSYQR
ncbi:unnamed protein product [Acanthoscelides obtectus]|uniref:Small acidic protein-like domain-containing protein n=2 Tax=Acanthoscelides obtectus TaxID=200917 RepID=A0A9P0M801_ACAOB|nr:unnamed protein product [Acanthoscelides obtectus]CAK1677261.1 Arginine/serine-rich coiled-coil protein 2 [Acanthoscelides obtectus]